MTFVMQTPCPPHAWSWANTVGYIRCSKCGEQHNHGSPEYERYIAALPPSMHDWPMTTNDTEQGGVPEISTEARAKWISLCIASDKDGESGPAFIQGVSNAAKFVAGHYGNSTIAAGHLAPFILPEPVDPLTAAFEEAYGHKHPASIQKLRNAFARRGLKIVEAKP